MKSKIFFLLGLNFLALSFFGCRSDEVEIGALEKDYYLTPYGASANDQLLQHHFYDTHHIYLLFNDTIQKEQTSVNPDNTPFYTYQAVNLGYSMTGSLSSKDNIFEFDYIQTDKEKQVATQFVQDKILPSLGPDLRPFSFLLIDKINYYVSNASTYYEMRLTNPVVFQGWRCTAIAVSGLTDMTDEEQTAYRNQILKTIVAGKISKLDPSIFDSFYSFCSQYYSTFKMDSGNSHEVEDFIKIHPTMMDLGFLSAYAYGNPYGFYMYNFKAKSYDLEDYTNAVFEYSEEEFTNLYGQYPIVMQKYAILKQIIADLGVIL
ncbi:MAG TPA: hypothetical protein DDZ96_03355 [Porphyromonadaceae bacterium]|jgi:hypothetical protein|nr:hypothetical protein [Porphyromonadaceae bacterium]HBX20370.1 hypothetical protein [Porphyromonadaceae bacterium]HCM20310.1 hypothetical protein [Porphyromonadaceae bacterium]